LNNCPGCWPRKTRAKGIPCKGRRFDINIPEVAAVRIGRSLTIEDAEAALVPASVENRIDRRSARDSEFNSRVCLFACLFASPGCAGDVTPLYLEEALPLQAGSRSKIKDYASIRPVPANGTL